MTKFKFIMQHHFEKCNRGVNSDISSWSITNYGNIATVYLNSDRHCGLVVRVPGYTTEMYCDSCEVRTEFIYVT
jgi:hypothetical protein